MRVLILIICTENDGKCPACMFDIHHHPFGLHGKRVMWLKSDLVELCWLYLTQRSFSRDLLPLVSAQVSYRWERTDVRKKSWTIKKQICVIMDYYELHCLIFLSLLWCKAFYQGKWLNFFFCKENKILSKHCQNTTEWLK